METAPDAFNTVSPASESRRGSPAVRAVKDITFGSVRPFVSLFTIAQTEEWASIYVQIAGMASKVFEHPFDLTKVRLQAQVLDASARFHGPIDCLTQTFKNEGVRGLYRVSPSLLQQTNSGTDERAHHAPLIPRPHTFGPFVLYALTMLV
jgi:mitochondrial ornithine carrier protein